MIDECLKAGADGHLSKPFLPSVYEVFLNALVNAKFKFYEHIYWIIKKSKSRNIVVSYKQYKLTQF